MAEATYLLSAFKPGDPQAAEQLLPLVYEELRKLAAHRLAQESPGQTLQATALVHEAYLRLVGSDPSRAWDGRGHFFAAAAEAMRRILVERARRKRRIKHGGGRIRIALDDVLPECSQSRDDVLADDLLAIDDALAQLVLEDRKAADLIKLRFFAGLSVEQAGEILGLSRSTAYDRWAYGRAWMLCRLRDHSTDTGN